MGAAAYVLYWSRMSKSSTHKSPKAASILPKKLRGGIVRQGDGGWPHITARNRCYQRSRKRVAPSNWGPGKSRSKQQDRSFFYTFAHFHFITQGATSAQRQSVAIGHCGVLNGNVGPGYLGVLSLPVDARLDARAWTNIRLHTDNRFGASCGKRLGCTEAASARGDSIALYQISNHQNISLNVAAIPSAVPLAYNRQKGRSRGVRGCPLRKNLASPGGITSDRSGFPRAPTGTSGASLRRPPSQRPSGNFLWRQHLAARGLRPLAR